MSQLIGTREIGRNNIGIFHLDKKPIQLNIYNVHVRTVRTYERLFIFVFKMNRSVSTNLQTYILVFVNRFNTVRTYVR